jgi:uncharacterized protein (DUF2235 family)
VRFDFQEMIVQDETEPTGGVTPARYRGKKIVIFADGTGNAFSSQESNVWRLYQALDKQEKPGGLMQIARYMPGVGTSANSVIRYIDGATGFGVPANVCKLYRFLCWNWTPGDEIYLFGFSRGAFTVRTLASMVAMQGLMPRVIDGRDVGKAEMKRNTAGAWRAYRRETAPLRKGGKLQMNPLIELARNVRDGLVHIKRGLFGQHQHAKVLDARPDAQKSRQVMIRFMGLFDTVEAYGMPFEGFRKWYDRLIWPIQFRNRKCSAIVEKVRHALSLDDERLTFHPIRFDQRLRDDGSTGPETQEVWFAGVHSDVGGGYADNAVALDPLIWMRDEAARQELIFEQVIMGRHERGRYPQAVIHNSRAGLANLYRYAPRRIRGGDEFGGPPVVHHSAVMKMQVGADGYAPLTLPGNFAVYPAGPQGWSGIHPHGMTRDIGAVEHVRSLMRQRTATNWMTILSIAGLVALPIFHWLFGSKLRLDPRVQDWIEWAIGGILPGWAYTWVLALASYWFISVPLIVIIWGIYLVNQSLADTIRDWGQRVWKEAGAGLQPPPPSD